jgi:signal transduction histidine kinase
VLWYIVLALRRYAGEYEYSHYETIQRTSEQVNTLESLHQIDRELNRALGLERVLTLWQDWAIRMTNAKAGGILLVDPIRGRMNLVTSFGYPPAMVADFFGPQQKASISKGITGRAARTADPFYEPDVKRNPDYVAISSVTRSQFSVPITRAERVIAVLTLEKNEVDGFSTEQRARVVQLCQRATFAVSNALLLQEAEEERRKLSVVLANIADSVIVTNQKGALILVNKAASQTFHLDMDQSFTSRYFIDVFRKTPLVEFFQKGLETGGTARREIAYNKATFQAHMIPVQQLGYLMVLHDITPFKELDNLKNDLVATVSHDLKNPLTAVRGYLELIHMVENLSDKSLTYLERARHSISDMTDLIEGLLSVARLESGFQLNLQLLELRPLLLEVINQHRVQIDEKGMVLKLEVPPDLPKVLGDAPRVAQIVNNLLGNAIKYTPPNGEIGLKAVLDNQRICITVRDTGIGIPPEALPNLFAKFSRVRDPKAEGIDGTGLGLYIVKRLVDAHVGTISVESTYGSGSTFTFTLPVATEEKTGKTDGNP